jgi:hypothetical protein
VNDDVRGLLDKIRQSNLPYVEFHKAELPAKAALPRPPEARPASAPGEAPPQAHVGRSWNSFLDAYLPRAPSAEPPRRTPLAELFQRLLARGSGSSR